MASDFVKRKGINCRIEVGSTLGLRVVAELHRDARWTMGRMVEKPVSSRFERLTALQIEEQERMIVWIG